MRQSGPPEIASATARRSLPKPNPVTRAVHRREVLRQITLPLVLALAALGAFVAWVVYAQVGTLERWAEIATLFLALPLLALSLLLWIIAAALLAGVTYILRFLPPYARLTQEAVNKVRRQIERGAEISTRPLVQIQSFLAMMEALVGLGKED